MFRLIFAFSIVAAIGARSAVANTAVDYYDYIAVVNEQTRFVSKLRTLQAITAEAILDYPRDWEKFAAAYDQVGYLLQIGAANATADEIQVADQLKQRIIDYYTTEVAATVAELLKKNRYPRDEEVKYLSALCSTIGLPTENVDEVFAKAINSCLKENVAPHVLAAQLDYLSDRLPLQVIWNAQVHLYWTWKGLVDRSNDRYLFDVAYYTLQVKLNADYEQLSLTTKEQIDQIINDLPKSLRHLFHKPDYCLLNNEYEEFLYTTNKIYINATKKDLYIFTWTEKYHVAENGPWVHDIRELDFVKTPELQLTFQLRSLLLKGYMYRLNVISGMDTIVSRDDGSVPENNDFTYEFVSASNALLLRQDGKLICSHPELYSEYRRFVVVMNDRNFTPATKACQWKAQECYKTAEN